MQRRSPARAILLLPALVFVLVGWPALREHSATYDETTYVAAGYSYLARGDFRLSLGHPPLTKILFALPWLLTPPHVSPAAERAFALARDEIDAEFLFGDLVLYQDNAPEPLLASARTVVLGLGAILVLLVTWWAGTAFGTGGGLLAGLVSALDPNLLAHGTLATTDLGFTLFFFAALFAAQRALTTLTPLALLGTIVAIGAAFASKYSAVLLVPTLLGLDMWRLGDRTPWPVQWRRRAADASEAGDPRLPPARLNRGGQGLYVRSTSGRAALLLLLAVLWTGASVAGLWTVYGFRYAARADGRVSMPLAYWVGQSRERQVMRDELAAGRGFPDPTTTRELAAARAPDVVERFVTFATAHRLLPEAYLVGLAHQHAMTTMRVSYLRGEVYRGGRAGYFPFVLGVKTPVATLALVALVLVLVLVLGAGLRALRRPLAAVLVPLGMAAIVLLLAMASSVNIGYRHVLPLVPLLAVCVGCVPLALGRAVGRRAAALVAIAAVAGLAVETMAIRPSFLTFFNVLAGGPRAGIFLLSDSNLDWGQSLPALRRWMADREIPRVNLLYFGTADPAAYGIDFVPLAGMHLLDLGPDARAGYPPRPPEVPGYVAISATHVQRTFLPSAVSRDYEFLRTKEPIAILGGTIYVYRVERWGE